MEPYMVKAKELVEQMTLSEKASLCSGADNWYLKGVERLGLHPILMTDGPHGLRKQVVSTDALDIAGSEPATCFPAACATACSFDRELLREIGGAIGEECRMQGVSVILGPGLNCKRSPLCGRNFEYFSEDPCLSGELAAAYVSGVQSRGVGTSAKHFALNNQERRRMTVEAVVDERAFRELYLAAFERVVKQARPWTVMCSYNRLEGAFASDSKLLLTDILRSEWGYEGTVVSDWGAVDDRVAGVAAGLDLEMPYVGAFHDREIEAAVLAGTLSKEALDASAARVTALILKAQAEKPGETPSDAMDRHHALAKRAARESAVLLKNDGNLLPGHPGQRAAVLGAFAKAPRYQGAGSSRIHPTRLDNACEELEKLGLSFDYAPGYDIMKDEPDEELISEACKAAAGKDIVYLFAGLPDRYESEGFDRTQLNMPAGQVALIRRVAQVNPNVAVILLGGGVMALDWADCGVKAMLLMYLGGQAGAGAAAELLLGKASPCGKLAETWPVKLEDTPSFPWFPGWSRTVEYRESIYVGYRYYDGAEKPVRYPFGHGLSYSAFAYENMTCTGSAGEGFTVSADIVNTGEMDASEVVQLYVAPPASALYKAKKELKGFTKVFLKAGEKKCITLPLSKRDFAFYDVHTKAWRAEDGAYELLLAASSRDIRLTCTLSLETGDVWETPVPDYRTAAPCYYDVKNGFANVPDDAFQALLDRPIPPRERVKGTPFDRNSTTQDIQEKWLGRTLVKAVRRIANKAFADREDMLLMMEGMLQDAPLRTLYMFGGPSVTPGLVNGFIDLLNGKFFRGLWRMIRK